MGRPRGSGKKKANTEGTTIPNDAKAVFNKWWPTIREARMEADQKQADAKAANSTYRSALKSYKKAGGDIDSLIEAYDLSKQDPADIDRHLRKVNDHLLWLKVPVGTQLGMFQDGRTIADHIENEKMEASLTDDIRRHNAKKRGYEAGKSSEVVENPYDGTTDEANSWQEGFREGQDELAKTIGESNAVGATIN